MSTRATYQFGRKYAPRVTLYIHHDGYPSGAAHYLYRALCHPNARGGFAEQMLRANDGAEITTSHSAHGDTEYRYSVSGNGPIATIKAEARYEFTDRWDVEFVGTAAEFVARHGDEFADWTEGGFFPFVEVPLPYMARWHNQITAAPILAESLETLTIWRENGVMTTAAANWQSKALAVAAIVQTFPSLMTEAAAEIVETLDATERVKLAVEVERLSGATA